MHAVIGYLQRIIRCRLQDLVGVDTLVKGVSLFEKKPPRKPQIMMHASFVNSHAQGSQLTMLTRHAEALIKRLDFEHSNHEKYGANNGYRPSYRLKNMHAGLDYYTLIEQPHTLINRA